MPLAQSSTPTVGLLLAVVGGFVLATLLFLPILRRARQGTEDAPTGKHALKPQSASEAKTRPAPASPDNAPPVRAQASSTPETSTQPHAKTPAAPAAVKQPREEPVEIATLPTNLYNQNHEAEFERVRTRLAKLRAELSDPR